LLGLLPLFVLAHFTHHLLTALATPLLPFIRDEFNLSYTRAGLLASAFSLAYGLAQLPAGWLADRIGRRTLITIGICGVALAGFLIGLSRTYLLLILLLVLIEIAGGSYHPAAPPLVAAATEPRNRGRALGFHMVHGSASHFLSPLIGVASTSGWLFPPLSSALPFMSFWDAVAS
jgi:FSR family fosmidomycin resistance protein-like MFS transporter